MHLDLHLRLLGRSIVVVEIVHVNVFLRMHRWQVLNVYLMVLRWRRQGMRLRLGLMLGAVEGVSVREVALVAGQKLGTHWHQFWCEGELLAVEDEHFARLMDVVLTLSALGKGCG